MAAWRRLAVPGALAAGVLAAACGHARRSEPIAGPLVLADEAARRGQAVFMWHCHHCHPGGEAGTGPSLNDKPLPGWLLRTQVRRGLGAMPSFPRGVLGDAELDDLVSYLVMLRRHGR